MHFFQQRKDFGLTFLALSSVTNLRKHYIRVQKVFWQLLWKLWDHFCNTKEVVGKRNFWKERQSFQSRKDCGLIFIVLSNMPNVGEQVMGLQNVFWQFLCKFWVYFYRTLHVFENTNFWKKGNLPSEEKILAKFSRSVECDQSQGPICKGLKGVLAITSEVIRSIL